MHVVFGIMVKSDTYQQVSSSLPSSPSCRRRWCLQAAYSSLLPLEFLEHTHTMHTHTHTECNIHLRNKNTNDDASNDPGVVCDETFDGEQTALCVDLAGCVRGLAETQQNKNLHYQISEHQQFVLYCSMFFNMRLTAKIRLPFCNTNNNHHHHHNKNNGKIKNNKCPVKKKKCPW